MIWDVPSTVIFWTKLSCWRKTYLSKAMLLICWCHRYTILRSSSRTGWPLRNIHLSYGNGSFHFCIDLFSAVSRKILVLDYIIWETRRVSYKKSQLLTLRKYLTFWWARVAHCFSFLCCIVLFVFDLCLVPSGVRLSRLSNFFHG